MTCNPFNIFNAAHYILSDSEVYIHLKRRRRRISVSSESDADISTFILLHLLSYFTDFSLASVLLGNVQYMERSEQPGSEEHLKTHLFNIAYFY